MTTRAPLRNLAPDERRFAEQNARELQALRDQASQCPEPDLISAAQMRVLPEDMMSGVNSHLAACRLCSVLAEGFADAAAEVAPKTSPELERIWANVSRRSSPRRWFVWSPLRPATIAAVAALAAVAIGLAVYSSRRAETLSTPAQPSVSAARINPVLVLPLQQADLKLPLDALTWRGDEDSRSKEYFAELGTALEPYNRRDYAEAVKTLAALRDRYPKAAETFFYLGVSELFAGHIPEAHASLERARELKPSFLEADIDWYLAIAHERQGDLAASSALLERLCARDNVYRKQSCELLPRLRPGTP